VLRSLEGRSSWSRCKGKDDDDDDHPEGKEDDD
jgi:hypothetical protein